MPCSLVSTFTSLQSFIDQAARQFELSTWSVAGKVVAALRVASPARSHELSSSLTEAERSVTPPEAIAAMRSVGGSVGDCLESVQAVYQELDWYRSSRSGTIYSQVLGPGCRLHNDEVRFGLCLLPPDLVYPNHVHGADEIYIILAGRVECPISSRRNAVRGPGDVIEVPAMTVHALCSGNKAVLMLWSWTGDITFDRYRFTS